MAHHPPRIGNVLRKNVIESTCPPLNARAINHGPRHKQFLRAKRLLARALGDFVSRFFSRGLLDLSAITDIRKIARSAAANLRRVEETAHPREEICKE